MVCVVVVCDCDGGFVVVFEKLAPAPGLRLEAVTPAVTVVAAVVVVAVVVLVS